MKNVPKEKRKATVRERDRPYEEEPESAERAFREETVQKTPPPPPEKVTPTKEGGPENESSRERNAR